VSNRVKTLQRWRWATRFAVVASLILWGVALAPLARKHLLTPIADVSLRVVEGEPATIDLDRIAEQLAWHLRGESLWTVDLVGLTERLKAEPAVAAVRVERIWPSRLEVALALRMPVLRWHNLDDDRWYWLDAHGRPFENRLSPANEAGIWVAAPAEQLADALRFFHAVVGKVPETIHLEGLTFSRQGGVTLSFAESVEWVLGMVASPAVAAQRVAWLGQRWSELVGRLGAVPVRVDLRHERGFAVSMPALTKEVKEEKRGRG